MTSLASTAVIRLVFMLVVASLAGLFSLPIGALECFIGQERDPATNQLRWALPYEHPCRCTALGVGGVSTTQLQRPFRVPCFESPLGLAEMKDRLGCSNRQACPTGEPMGMENGGIANDSITASSYWNNQANHSPLRARLNTKGFAAAWCKAGNGDPHPWIQVDFKTKVYITGLITQARGGDSNNNNGQRVTHYNVTYSSDGESWRYVTDTACSTEATTFSANIDTAYEKKIEAAFETVLHTRFLRILPVEWIGHCSMRFEVIGCYA